MSAGKRLVVIGAGPMGLAAALGARNRGFDVEVFEKGSVGESLKAWGPTRFFTPLDWNVNGDMRFALGSRLPDEQSLLTGPELAAQVLEPLAESAALRGRVHTGSTVVAVGRSGFLRGDLADHPLRSERPFRILTRGREGERYWEAESVLDASGGFALPNPVGTGGVPAIGEEAAARHVTRDLGALDRRLRTFKGRSILLVGHGHSAATAVLALAGMAAAAPASRLTWVVRSSNRRPCEEVAEDPLPERRRVASRANDLAESPPLYLSVRRRTSIDEIRMESGRLRVVFSREGEGLFDEIVSLTGYRPDNGFLSELSLRFSPATEGPELLSRALSGQTDCLSVPRVGSEDLASGEPGFFFVGSKSYGRRRTFLLRTGFSQLELLLDALGRGRA